jgi:hypothetical protein
VVRFVTGGHDLFLIVSFFFFIASEAEILSLTQIDDFFE